MILVEHRPEVILKVIQSDPALYEWFENEWVHITAIDPDTNEFYYFADGKFIHYLTTDTNVKFTSSVNNLIETSKEMVTNHIVDATKENLPIYVIKNEE